MYKRQDELFAQAQKEADTEKRTELFNQAFSKAQDEAIYAVIGNPLELFAYNNSLCLLYTSTLRSGGKTVITFLFDSEMCIRDRL